MTVTYLFGPPGNDIAWYTDEVTENPVLRDRLFSVRAWEAGVELVVTISWQDLTIVFATQERSQAMQLEVQRI